MSNETLALELIERFPGAQFSGAPRLRRSIAKFRGQ
jgi:hypothetical protein